VVAMARARAKIAVFILSEFFVFIEIIVTTGTIDIIV
jgi:hypothetical protein